MIKSLISIFSYLTGFFSIIFFICGLFASIELSPYSNAKLYSGLHERVMSIIISVLLAIISFGLFKFYKWL